MLFLAAFASAWKQPLNHHRIGTSTLRSAPVTRGPPAVTAPSPLIPSAAFTTSAGTVMGARVMLLAAGAIFGTYPVVLRKLYAASGPTLPPIFVVAARFIITSLILATCKTVRNVSARHQPPAFIVATTTSSAILRRNPRSKPLASAATAMPPSAVASSLHADSAAGPARAERRQLRLAAFELACVGLAGNFLSVWGLSRVTAALAETLLGCVHVFVPLITVAVSGSTAVGRRTWQACALSFIAVAISACGSAVASAGVCGSGLGLVALIGSAALYSLARVRTQHHVCVDRIDSSALNCMRFGHMGCLASAALLLDAWAHPLGASRMILGTLTSVTPRQWALVVVSCLASGVAGSSLQFRAQRVLPAASMQPFFALQPLFACGWAVLLLAEPVAPSMLTGGALMVAAALLATTDSRTTVDR